MLTADTTNKKLSVTGDVNVGTRFGNRLFSDNFEIGSLRLWNDGISGSISASTTQVHDGKYAAQINPSGSPAYAYTRIAASNTVYARAWVYVSSQTSGTAELFNLETSGPGYWKIQRSGGNLHFYNGSTSTDTDSGSALSTGAWHLIEMRVTIGAGTGVNQVWLDGTQVINQSSQSNGTDSIENMAIGDTNNDTFTAYIDDVAVDTATTGTSSSLNVDDSFHVGGASTFGGNVLIQTTAPSSQLEIRRDVEANGENGIRLSTTDGHDWKIYQAEGSSALSFWADSTGADILTLDDNDGSVLFQNSSDSTTAFQIQDEDGNGLVTADTSNDKVQVVGDVNVGSRYGSRLFSDAFESGGLGLWDQVDTDISVDDTIVHNGKYAALLNPNSTVAEAEVNISENSTVYVRAWVYVDDQTSSNADLLTLENDLGTSYWTVYRNGTQVHLWNGVINANAGNGGSFTLDAWHLIEMRITTGNPTGVSQVWLDGTQVINAASQNNGSELIDSLALGDENGRDFTAYVDDLAVDTVTTGTSSSLNVDDSLHVGGTASFGNDILINVNDNDQAQLRLMETNDRGFNLFYDSAANIFALQANDGGSLNTIMTVDRVTGATLFQSSDDTGNINAFQVQNASGASLFNINAEDGGVAIGSDNDFNDGRGILRLYNEANTNGFGTKILFGDGNITSSQNVWIGERGIDGINDDTDQLRLQAANGVYITGEYDGSVEIAQFFSDVSAGTGALTSALAQFNSRAVFGYDGATQDAVVQGNTGKGFKLYTDGNDNTTRSTFGIDVDGAALFRNYTDTANAFQVSDVGGNELFNIDTSVGLSNFVDSNVGIGAVGNGNDKLFVQSATDTVIVGNGTGSNDLLNLRSTGSNIVVVNSTGQLQLATQGTTGGVQLGGDTLIYRSGTNEISLGSNDSLVVPGGTLRVTIANDNALTIEDAGGADIFEVDTNGAGATGVTIGEGTQIEKVLHFAVDFNPAAPGTPPAVTCATGTVTGAVTTDRIIANPDPADLSDLHAWHGARVSASNTVQACFYQGAGAATDPGNAITVFGIIITP